MTRARLFLPAVFMLLVSASAVAQQTEGILSMERNKVDHTPTSITFAPGMNWRDDQADEIFRKYLGIDGIDNTMVQAYSIKPKNGATTKRYNQYYKGIIVDYGSYTLTSRNGIVQFITGNNYKIDYPLTAVPAITESAAFGKALEFVGADKYMWQDSREEQRIKQMYNRADTSFLPRGILKWVEDFNGRTGDRKLHLAYTFNIYAQSPLSRQIVYIDAATGKVLYTHSLIKHTAATGRSRYSGVVPFETSNIGTTFVLYDSTRGSGIHTLNMNNGSSYGASTSYTSVSNTWPLAPADSVALDAHWGAELVYDYWKNVQGRLSYDNADAILRQYIHYNTGFNNAFWNGSEMTYGDGTGCSSGFTPLMSLDVTGHEIGHGVCEYTANLVYAMESGAMNESFSDCWGATIEAWAGVAEGDAVPKSTWQIGEEIKCGNPMRRMDFPKLKGDPDTYDGINWVSQVSCVPSGGNDQCGVHTNSGVMNKWYFLVVAGGGGTNDNSDTYSITGIGFTKGANILYQSELALSSTADYNLMRATSINAASTIYGPCSPELITVTNAWFAVGVGAAYVPFPANITGTNNICVGGTTMLSDVSPGGTWSSSNPAVATVGSTTGFVSGLTAGMAVITYTVGSICDATTIVTVNAYPSASITPSLTAILCIGSSVALTANPGAGYTYQWQLGGVNIPGATNMVHAATVIGNYTVNVSNSAGCSTGSLTTTVNPVAPPLATITPVSSTTICAGGSVMLNANTGAGYTYQWLLDGSPISGGFGSAYLATAAGNYTVIVTNTSGCSTTSGVTVVVVNPLPAAITGLTTLCVTLTTTLNNTSPGGTWSSSNPAIATVGAGSGIVTGMAAGPATITYMLGTGCLVTTPVLVNPLPLPITGSPNVCLGSTTTLSEAISGGVWSSGNTGIATVSTAGTVTGVSTGSATISYTLGAGCFATSDVTVNPLPPGITGTATVCAGATTTLSNAAPGGSWSSGSMAIATVAPGTGIVSGVSVGTANITYMLPTGCITSLPVNVTSVSGGAIGGPPSMCLGQTVTMTNPVSGGVWASSNPSIALINPSGVVIGLATGAAIISYTVTNSCGIATATTFITVNAPPVVAPITGTLSICSGAGTTLSNATPMGVWTSSAMSVATIGSSSGFVTAVLAGTSNISYTVTSSFGCSASATATFNVITPFTASITPGGPTSFCTGASVMLNATTGPGMIYQWKKNGVNIPGATLPNYTASTAGTYTILITATSGCNALSAPVVINVNPAPIVVPVVSVTASPGFVFCAAPSLTTFTASSIGGGTPVYDWYVNGLVVGVGAMYAYTPAAGDVVRCVLTSNATCAFPTTVARNDTIRTSATFTPAVGVSPNKTVVCTGDNVIYTATPVYGGAAPTYQWTQNGINVGTGASYSCTPNNGDVLMCNMTSNYPCLTTNLAVSTPLTVVTQARVTNTISIAVTQSSIVAGSVDTFIAVAPNGGSAPMFQWYIDGLPVPGATASMFITSTLVNGQTVTCSVTSSLPCATPKSVTSAGIRVVVSGGGITGVPQLNNNAGNFTLLPNPNSGTFTIEGLLSNAGDEQADIAVTNVLGQVIYSEKASVRSGILSRQITLDKTVANGMYLVRVTAGADHAVFHMVLNK